MSIRSITIFASFFDVSDLLIMGNKNEIRPSCLTVQYVFCLFVLKPYFIDVCSHKEYICEMRVPIGLFYFGYMALICM